MFGLQEITTAAGFVAFGWIISRIEPPKAGFYCDDPSIVHRYTGDSISLRNLVICSLLLPQVVIVCGELCRHSEGRLRLCKPCCWQFMLTFLQGMVAVIVPMEILKVTIGGLRPHFLDTCKPDFSAINCSSGYVSEYRCTNNVSRTLMWDSYKSFPSGHAALSLYVAGFVLLYLRRECSLRSFPLNSVLFKSCVVTWSVVCCLSRLADNRHHWWDVLAGSLLAVCATVYTYTLMWPKRELISCSKRSETSKLSPQRR